MTVVPTNPANIRDHVNQNPPLPRPARQRRRAKADRGLPPEHELKKLATEYLRVQRNHWPAVVNAGLLPDDDAAVAAMVEDFQTRHRTGLVDPIPIQAFAKLCPKAGGIYNRYSCDNSSPTSIIDQMVKGLEKARQELRFVPWQYIFADYSVSGLTPSRQGYSSYKNLLQDKNHLIETTYIDDFTRASRDEMEWWRLAYLSRRLQKRMIGASDGFDLSAPNCDIMIAVYGLVSRLFIKGLREKVNRGMRGAARRGGCMGKLPLGFTRVARCDNQGRTVCDKDGVPEYVPSIDPATCNSRKLMYELFVEKCWSIFKIAKHFNALKVDNWGGWTTSGIRNLLRSASAIGVFIWNKTRREYDHEEEKWTIVKNPRKEWEIYHDPALAIVPIEVWKQARKKVVALRAKNPLTGRTKSRNEKCASTLFSGTLICGYCGHEIKLVRSSGRYKVMGCYNGSSGKHECELSVSKSTGIIEKSLLGFLQVHLLTDENLEALVVKANGYLANEAAKPRTNTNPLKASIRTKEATIKKLFDRIENCEGEDLVQAYERRIAETQKEVNQLKIKLHQAETQNEAPPPPLDLVAVKGLLADLRGLLLQEIPAAAEAIRALTGPITIRQEKDPGKKRGGKWIATFSPDLLGWLRKMGDGKDCPDTVTLEYLCSRIWITPTAVTVPVDYVHKYERVVDRVKEMRAKGSSIWAIAAALGETWHTVHQVIFFVETGKRPKIHSGGKNRKSEKKEKRKIDDAEVVRLHDEEKLPFTQIAKRLEVSVNTATYAYVRQNPQPVRDAAEGGQTPKRGEHAFLKREIFDRIRSEILAGRSPKKIAADVGCGVSTVYRFRQKMSLAQPK